MKKRKEKESRIVTRRMYDSAMIYKRAFIEMLSENKNSRFALTIDDIDKLISLAFNILHPAIEHTGIPEDMDRQAINQMCQNARMMYNILNNLREKAWNENQKLLERLRRK